MKDYVNSILVYHFRETHYHVYGADKNKDHKQGKSWIQTHDPGMTKGGNSTLCPGPLGHSSPNKEAPWLTLKPATVKDFFERHLEDEVLSKDKIYG